MFERFTERARQVVVLAQEEARSLGHDYIGTEHVLLGLIREEQGLAATVLRSFDITVDVARGRVVEIVGASGEPATSGAIPFTSRAKKVLELSLREALSLGHNHIGPEHILLGLLREDDGVASKVLRDLGVNTELTRNEVIRMLSGPEGQQWMPPDRPSLPTRRKPIGSSWFDGIGDQLLGLLDADIRSALGREPDPGDLLLVLACVKDSLSADALTALGVEPDALWGTIERLRKERRGPTEELGRKIVEVREAKEQAIQAEQWGEAAVLRDQERELLREQPHASTPPEAIDEIRRTLGIPRRD